jgi:hypothetical protein
VVQNTIRKTYPAVFLIHFNYAAAILLESLALTVQFSLPYKEAGRVSVLYIFILVFFKVFYGLNILFLKPAVYE